MKDGRNEFPVRLDELSIFAIAKKSEDNSMYVRSMQILRELPAGASESATVRTLLALHEYLLERRVDPGFQVVIGE